VKEGTKHSNRLVNVTLRLTVSQLSRYQVPLDAYDQVLVLEWTVNGVAFVAPRLGREDGSVPCQLSQSVTLYVYYVRPCQKSMSQTLQVYMIYMALVTIHTRHLSVQVLNSRLSLILSNSRYTGSSFT
jgi:hypothetical protein